MIARILNAALLTAVWAAVTGSASAPNLVLGFAVGMVALYLIREQMGAFSGFGRPLAMASLALLFLKELILSAWRVARLVMSPRMDLQPGIFAYRLKVDRDFEIALLANLITLTPGTLSVDVSADRTLLYVHALDCSDVEQARRDIEQGFERKILEAFHR